MGIVQGLIASLKTASASYDSDAQAFFTKSGITDVGIKNDWNTFVLAAKAHGYYSLFHYFHPFVGGDATKHSFDAINVTTDFDIVWSGTAATHNSNGVTSASGSIGSTGFTLSSFFTDTSGNFGVYVDGSTFAGIDVPIGEASLSNFIAYAGGDIVGTMFSSTNINDSSYLGQGIIALNVESTFDEFVLYYNGTPIAYETASGVAGGELLYFGSYLPSNGSTANLRAGWAAESFTPAQMASFYTDLQAFQTARGRAL